MAKVYNIEEHIHRYAVWTAARAVQRGFTTTKIIKDAIKESGLREFSEKEIAVNENDYKKVHITICNKLINEFTKIKDLEEKASFGRASKIVSIYLKTAVIIASKGQDKRAEFIYPPIDGILLKNIGNKFPELKGLKKEKWTTFKEDKYFEILGLLKRTKIEVNWKMEEFWSSTNED